MTLTLILSHTAAFVAGIIIAPALVWAIGAVYVNLFAPDEEFDDDYESYDF